MSVVFHRNFKKQFKKIPKKVQVKFSERLELFLSDNTNPLLNIHPLHGEMVPLISMNITSDYRVLFIQDKKSVTFHYIGTHSELYS